MLLSFICAQEEKWAWLRHFIAGLLCSWLWKLPLQGPGASAQLLGLSWAYNQGHSLSVTLQWPLSLGMQEQVFLHLFFEELSLVASFLPGHLRLTLGINSKITRWPMEGGPLGAFL